MGIVWCVDKAVGAFYVSLLRMSSLSSVLIEVVGELELGLEDNDK